MDEYQQLIQVEAEIARLENDREKLRESILHGMMADGVDQDRQHGFIFTAARNKARLDYDKKKVPAAYMTTKPVPDEARIRAELEAGKVLLWAALDDSKPFKLQMRREAVAA